VINIAVFITPYIVSISGVFIDCGAIRHFEGVHCVVSPTLISPFMNIGLAAVAVVIDIRFSRTVVRGMRSSIHSMVDRGRDKRYANGKINKGARAL